MTEHRPDPEATRRQRIARVTLAAGLFLLGLWTLRDFLPALVWASIFAIVIWPPYQRTRQHWAPGPHNVLLPSLFTAGVALLFLLPLALIGERFAHEAHGILQWIDDARRNGIPPPVWLGSLPFGANQAIAWWNDNLSA